MRIAQLADIHFGSENGAAIDATKAIINHCDVDVVAICGDITQNGRSEEFEAARAWVDQLIPRKIVVQGNHDTPMYGLLHRVVRPWSRFNRAFEDYSAPILCGDIGLAPLNSARGWQIRPNWAEGAINLAALDAALNNIATAQVQLIVCHHPLAHLDTAPLETATTRGRRAEALLCKQAKRVVLTGHVHAPSVTIRQVGGGDYMAVAAGTLSTRLRGQKAAFNLIDVTIDHLRVLSVDIEQYRGQARGEAIDGSVLFDAPWSSI